MPRSSGSFWRVGLDELRIDPLTRVEGLGRVKLFTENGKIKDVRLEIFEPPRFFEKLLVGKTPDQVIDTVARICGLCPIAYQMSALEAFESIFEVTVPDHIRDLRRVIYCGEWISSHSAHVFFLHLPDFYGKDSFLGLPKDILEMGLRLRATGNKILEILGGRHIHPVNLRVGGFYKLPSENRVEEIIDLVEGSIPLAEEAFDLVLSLDFPSVDIDYEFISLGGTDLYPYTEGKIVSSKGWSVEKSEFESKFEEYQLTHSTALYSKIREGSFYLVGAMARFRNNFHLLPKEIKEKVGEPPKNPFKSIVVRVAEILYSLKETKRLLERVYLKEHYVDWKPKEGEGVGVTEAPRGILYHRYRVNSEGKVLEANIIPPTSQNQGIVERTVLETLKTLKNEDMLSLSERTIRTFDPCISCASHTIEISELSDPEDGFNR